jgi:hypothetical protein
MTTRDSSRNFAMREANRIMANYPEKFKDRLPIMIWAAKFNDCPLCHAKAGHPCNNLLDLRKGKIRANRWPHTGRVDWAKLVRDLRKRGYRISR